MSIGALVVRMMIFYLFISKFSMQQDEDDDYYVAYATALLQHYEVLPARCCLPVPAHSQSDSGGRLPGLHRWPPDYEQDYWTAVCR